MGNYELNFFGILFMVIVFLALGMGKFSKSITMFLIVVLVSMVLLNWQKIRPLFLKEVA